jgi:hypothetical protein
MAPLFLPSLNIFRGDKGGHVHMTAGAASTTGNISTLLHGSLRDADKDISSVAVKGKLSRCSPSFCPCLFPTTTFDAYLS